MEPVENIPEPLRQPVEAARDWLNESQGTAFSVTGLVDYETALNASPGEAYELGIVLCDGEICKREKVQFTPEGGSYRFSINQPDFEMPAELDPPAGLRSEWLDKQLSKQEFLLLLFYRGRW